VKEKKSILDLNISISRISLVQMAIFAKNLSLMLKAGLTISESIEINRDQSTGKLRKVLGEVLSSIEAGQSLSNSFARCPKVFSNLFIDITRVGEMSGTLEENLSNIANHLEKEKELSAKIKGAMFYPIIVIVAASLLGLGMAFFILPKITPLFVGLKMQLPLSTRMLIWVSNLIRTQGIWLLVGVVAVVLFFIWLVKQKFSHPATHWLLIKTPIVKKIVCYSNLAKFNRTLGTLLRSGLNIDEALDITAHTISNYYFKKSLSGVVKRVSKGSKLAGSLEQSSNLYPIITTRMISVGEKSGKLEENLFYLANFYETEVDNSTKALSTVIEPVLLLIIGLSVAFLALSIITPIYQITGNIQR